MDGDEFAVNLIFASFNLFVSKLQSRKVLLLQGLRGSSSRLYETTGSLEALYHFKNNIEMLVELFLFGSMVPHLYIRIYFQ